MAVIRIISPNQPFRSRPTSAAKDRPGRNRPPNDEPSPMIGISETL